MAEQFPAPFGRYHLLSRLAVGGMAELYLARVADAPADAPFAVLKRLLPHLATQRDYINMFLDEARLTSQLEHPSLTRIYEFGRCDGEYFIAMEFVDGVDVLAVLRECAGLGRRMAPELGVYIAHRFLDALDYVHALADENGQPLHIVHRDVSPSNVLVSQTGEVKLIDFGIARAEQRLHRTRAGLLKGKVGYMSPEQVSRTEVDARSDIFSAGVVLAELLIGRRLFVAPRELDTLLMVRYARLDRLDRHGGHVDAELQGILRRALCQHPGERYATAAEFRDALGGWLRGQSHLPDDEDEQMSGLAATLGLLVRKLYPRAWHRLQTEMNDGTERDLEPPVGVSADLAPRGKTGRKTAPGDTVPDLSIAAAHEEITADATVTMANPLSDWLEQGQTDDVPADIDADDDAPAAAGTAAGRDSVAPVDARRQGAAAVSLAGAIVHEPESSTRETMRGLPLALLMEAMAGTRPDIGSISDIEASRGNGSGAELAGPPVHDGAVDLMGLAPTPILDVRIQGGSLSDSSPLAVLHHLAQERATGRLSVATGEIRKDVHLRDGVAVHVASNVFSEHFGEHLVRHGAVSPGELSMALAMVAQYQESLDDTLASLHLLTAAEIAQQRAALMRQQIIDVCTWTRGTYHWYAADKSPHSAPAASSSPVPARASEAAVDLIPVVGSGALAVPDEAVSVWLERLGAPDQLRPRLTEPRATTWRVFQLGPLAEDVCGMLDGDASIDALRAHFARSRRDGHFLRVLHLLYQAGLATSGT